MTTRHLAPGEIEGARQLPWNYPLAMRSRDGNALRYDEWLYYVWIVQVLRQDVAA